LIDFGHDNHLQAGRTRVTVDCKLLMF